MSVNLIEALWEAGYLVFQDKSGNDLLEFVSGGVQMDGTCAITGALTVAGAVAGLVPVTVKASSYQVAAADNGTTFHTTGASGTVEFTLPAPSAGLHFRFCNTVDQDMTITCTNKIVAVNNAAADGITYTTATELIGAVCDVVSDGALWYVTNLSDCTVTIVSA